MKKITKKQGIIASLILLPIAVVIAFAPKLARHCKRNKYSSAH